MKSNKIAKKYARALFDTTELANLEFVEEKFKELIEIWNSTPDLKLSLTNRSINSSEREELVKKFTETLNAKEIFTRFCSSLLNRGRITLLPEIWEEFQRLLNAHKKLKHVEVTSARDLTTDEQEEIKENLESKFAAQTKISWKIDKNLISGIKIKIGDRLIDASAKKFIDDLRVALANVDYNSKKNI
ncbi:MAG TPA: ATP synthase F1 subunit delta [Oligoflexia bacterium]|nr:ATP synthase F1 subunit delta [Oligoflexia bacterium]HMP26839.1 ATP synthase F1 subunit delta [Oligoflexia bacterium]